VGGIERDEERVATGVSTKLVENELEILPEGDSAILHLRMAVRRVLSAAASPIPELTGALPEVLTLVGDSPRRGGEGRCATGLWQLGPGLLHEVFLSARHLDRDADSVAVTVVHELAHLLAAVRGISDTSNRGRYHSKRFKACAEELGLLVEYRRPHGYHTTSLSPELRRRLGGELRELEAALVLRIRNAPPTEEIGTGEPEGVKEKRKYITAACGCPRVFRMAVGYWVPDTIPCEICGEYFVDLESSPFLVNGSAGRSKPRRPTPRRTRVALSPATSPLMSITTTSKEIE
jgi:hypothetical protein